MPSYHHPCYQLITQIYQPSCHPPGFSLVSNMPIVHHPTALQPAFSSHHPSWSVPLFLTLWMPSCRTPAKLSPSNSFPALAKRLFKKNYTELYQAAHHFMQIVKWSPLQTLHSCHHNPIGERESLFYFPIPLSASHGQAESCLLLLSLDSGSKQDIPHTSASLSLGLI